MATLLSAYPGFPDSVKLLNNVDGSGAYTISGDDTGREENITFQVPFPQKETFLQFARGYQTSTTVGGLTTVTRNYPLSSPFTPGLYAVSYQGKAMGADKQVSIARPWPFMHITMSFGYLQYGTEGDNPYMSFRYRASTSVATVPGAKLRFSGGEYIDHDYGILLGQFAIEITKHQLLSVQAFIAAASPLAGKVNSDTVVIDGFAYAPGYLLIPTFEAEHSVSSSGMQTGQATVSAIYRSIPWNSDITSLAAVEAVTPAPYVTTPMSGFFSS